VKSRHRNDKVARPSVFSDDNTRQSAGGTVFATPLGMKIFGGAVDVLKQSLDVRLERHQVLSGNLANLDTPDFSPKDIDVSASMGTEQALGGGMGMARTNAAHMDVNGGTAAGGSHGVVETDAAGSERKNQDGNGVDLDRTMSALAENALQYQASSRVVSKKMALLKYVASDGAA
jgi:flagellar basal-body rod protein FlgB